MHKEETRRKMETSRKFVRFIVWPGVILLQLIMTQVVTFVFSFAFPDMESIQQNTPLLFTIAVGISFTIGAFLTGWLALKWRWLKGKPRTLVRLAGALVGAYLPLIAALLIYRTIEAGNPFFLVSVLACILGFHLPGFINPTGRE
jgi:hypothetical protein